jgi:hypothetical protein
MISGRNVLLEVLEAASIFDASLRQNDMPFQIEVVHHPIQRPTSNATGCCPQAKNN